MNATSVSPDLRGLPTGEGPRLTVVSGHPCPICGQAAGDGSFYLRTREYLSGRRQLVKTQLRTGLCAHCHATLRKRRWQATALITLPAVLLSCFGFGKISFALLAINLFYVIRHGRYTVADHLLYGKHLLPVFDAQFAALGTHPDSVDATDRSLPTGRGHWWLRVTLAFLGPVAIAVLWVKLSG